MDTRPRPTLTPLWTPHYSLDGTPRSPLTIPRHNHIYSPAPRSPKTLPTPVYPTGSHDGLMRQHERAMVDRFDQRLRQDKQKGEPSPPGSACVSRPLSPITEGLLAPRDISSASTSPLPSARRTFPQPPTPASPGATFPRRQTLVAETRSMLLAGLSDDGDRRQSVPFNARRASKATQPVSLEGLRAWGHVYYGDAKNADVFVNAVALRRISDASTASEHSNTDEAPKHSPNPGQQPRRHSVVRARVRPRNIDRKPFLIQREFDLTELRSTIPEPLRTQSTPGFRRASQAELSSPAHRRTLATAGRRSSAISRHGLQSPTEGNFPISIRESRALRASSTAVPVHLEYARAHLPVLAALIVSGHVREGDVIDLPLPHPEAWTNTVAYVYTGQGELTDAIRENILHLAGKV